MPDAEDFNQAAASVEDTDAPQTSPRVLYIDPDDDLPAVLDRVEGGWTPAIVVLPEGARAVRGVVAVRLLKRRADASGIEIAAVTTDRTTIAQLQGVGIRCAQTVGEARRLVTPASANPTVTPGDTFTAPQPANAPRASAPAPAPNPVPAMVGPIVTQTAPPAGDNGQDDGQDEAQITPMPASQQHRGFRRWFITVLALLMLVLAGAGAKLLFFPDVSIAIRYAQQRFDHIYRLKISDMAAVGIPLRHTHMTRTAHISVAGTGAVVVPYGYARGTVTFANAANGYVRVPAGTILTALNGSRYATVLEIRVPAAVHNFAGTTNGQQSVEVRAIEPGTIGNMPPTSIGTIVGRLAGVLLVTNYDAISGGSMRTIYSVTTTDIDAATKKLGHQLTDQERGVLLHRYAKSPVRILEHTMLSAPVAAYFERSDHPYATISLTARTDLTYIHEQDVRKYAEMIRGKQLAGRNQRIIRGSELIQVAHAVTGSTAVAIRVQDRTQPTIDVANLRALLTGRSIADGRALLEGSARNGNWRYSLHITPSWAFQFPQSGNLIAITIMRS